MTPRPPISPSAIDTFRLCQRKWAFSKIDKLPDVPNRYAQFGLDGHALYQNWFTHGHNPGIAGTEPAFAVLAGMHLWPAPADVFATERHVFATSEGIQYHGFADLIYFDNERWAIGDHKFSSDPH